MEMHSTRFSLLHAPVFSLTILLDQVLVVVVVVVVVVVAAAVVVVVVVVMAVVFDTV